MTYGRNVCVLFKLRPRLRFYDYKFKQPILHMAQRTSIRALHSATYLIANRRNATQPHPRQPTRSTLYVCVCVCVCCSYASNLVIEAGTTAPILMCSVLQHLIDKFGT